MATAVDSSRDLGLDIEPRWRPRRSRVRTALRKVSWRDPRLWICGAATIVVAYLVLLPLGTMVVASFQQNFLGSTPGHWTAATYGNVLGSSSFGSLSANSVEFAGLSALFAMLVGFVLAWIYVRTNTPGKTLVLVAATVPMIIPGILDTAAWALLLAPNVGPVNTIVRDVGLPQFNVYSMAGMVFIQSLHVAPISFLMGLATFSSVDRSLEEAAATSGADKRAVLRRVILPLTMPAILGAALLTFVLNASSFEVPQIIGAPSNIWVWTTQMYNVTRTYPVNYNEISVIGTVVLVIVLAGIFFGNRLGGGFRGRETITGKGFRVAPIEIGRWRWGLTAAVIVYFLVAVVLPLAMLLWSSFLPGYENPSSAALHSLTLGNYRSIMSATLFVKSLEDSLIASAVSAALVTVISTVVAYITTKTTVRGRNLLDMLAMAPLGIPTIIIGVSILFFYLLVPLPVYGSLAIMVIAFTTMGLPFGLRFIVPGLVKVKQELEETALASGASWSQALRRIYVPLAAPALLAAFLFTFIVAFREMSAAIFLTTDKNAVLAVQVYYLWTDGEYSLVCAIGSLMIALTIIVVLVGRKIASRSGVRFS